LSVAKKTRLYKVAKELNIASQDLIEFLKEKKYPVQSINSPVDEEMYDAIMERFHMEKSLAEKKEKFKKQQQMVKGEVPFSRIEPRLFQIKVKDLEGKKSKKVKIEFDITPEEIPEEIIEYDVKVNDLIPEPESVRIEFSLEEEEIDEEKKVAEEKRVEEIKEKEEEPLSVGEKEKVQKEITEQDEEEMEEEEVGGKFEKPTRDKVRRLSKKGIDIAEKMREKRKREQELEKEDKRPEEKQKKKKRKSKRKKVDIKEVEASIKETLARMEDTRKKKKRRKRAGEVQEVEDDTKVIKVSEYISVSELADLMDVEVNEVIKKCMGLGLLVSINQRLDLETIRLVADEFDYEVELLPEYGVDLYEEEEDTEEDTEERFPVVTVMGHVDHGKTSLLDYIRKTNVVFGEKGGITQHIGAYELEYNKKKICFLDTPGHEAFTAMRARGAQITDIVVLVVAADDSVMPQTVEAIDHSKAAGVSIIIAINKMDKPNADPDKIRKQLAEHGILVESWGGKYQEVELSAKTGAGVEDLLETILLEAEVLELKANPHKKAKGVVIESKLDRGKGPIATVLIQNGTLAKGEAFICGIYSGKVRVMYNERKKALKKAPPSTPVQVVGFSGLPQVGDTFMVLDSEREAKELSMKRQLLKREQVYRQVKRMTLDRISEQVKLGGVTELSIVLKADVDGSIEALSDSLMKLGNEKVAINIIHKSVGAIRETDVFLASASNAIIMGFHVRPNAKAREIAEKEEVDIRLYNVIYDAISDVEKAVEGLLEPEYKEEVLGTVEVRQTFKISRIGTIAGCFVTSGKINRNDNIRLIRDGKEIYDGTMNSLKRFKDDVKEVNAGFECGIKLENFDDIKVGDIIEPYKVIKLKKV